jgi:NAD(P)-dependent dehydrogenase (short-subunit alcohol dehydrogenase family)
MDLELNGSVVLVTGGSGGLGRALCRRLVEEGASVALCGRDEDRLEDAAAELEAAGGEVLALRCDVSEAGQLPGLVAATLERFGHLEGLVNNAGRATNKLLVETTDDDWQEDLDLKLMAAIRLARLTVPHLKASGRGSIVNTLAIAGKAPGAFSLPSSVTRAGGLALTKVMSKELGPEGIRVNAVLVGTIESPQWRRKADAQGLSPEELYASMGRDLGISLGRVGRPEEFADLVTYLLSARSSFVTGTAINCDGGQSPVA